ncbi:hypothetical protein KI387_026358, partial [Taxus chinensis]
SHCSGAFFAVILLLLILSHSIPSSRTSFFKGGKDFYARIGRPRKRGYFLYGPPGMGKTSLVGAIANHMKYHIFELSERQSDLDDLLAETWRKSVIVIEDIDCSLHLTDKGAAKKEMFIHQTEEKEQEIVEAEKDRNLYQTNDDEEDDDDDSMDRGRESKVAWVC